MSDTATRRVETVTRGTEIIEGGGVKVNRLIGGPQVDQVGAILLLDKFGSDDPKSYAAGFPPHPHRGFETVTYMIKGSIHHKDNKGGEGHVTDGGVQWMTAARGVVHSEMPGQTKGLMMGFQIWLNLPAAQKMGDPWYRDIPATDIPTFKTEEGVNVKLIAGLWGEHKGAGPERATQPLIADITLPAGTSTVVPVPLDHMGVVSIIEGGVKFGPSKMTRELLVGDLGLLSKNGTLAVSSAQGGRFLIIAAKPLGEPVSKFGPFVMNSPEEIRQALADFRSGQF